MVMYQHTQIAWTILISLCAFLIVLGFITLPKGSLLLFSAVLMFLGVIGILFHALTIKVGDKYLQWYFGPGFWKKEILLEDIVATDPVTNKWYYGWGIRNTPHGWLYNGSGLSALEIKLKNGKSVCLGTDQAELLKEAIDRQLLSTNI